MATGDLTTLANVKQWINVSTTTDDALLTRLITAISAAMQAWISRVLVSAAYVDTFDGKGTAAITLPNYPVTAVSSVVIDGVTIPQSTNTGADGWTIDADGYSVQLRGFTFPKGSSNVTISYTAGYAPIPADVEQACINLIHAEYAARTRVGVSSRSLAGESVSYTGAMNENVKMTLAKYKKVVPV